MLKRIFCILLCVILSVSVLGACDDDNSSSSSSGKDDVSSQTSSDDKTTTSGDSSFSDNSGLNQDPDNSTGSTPTPSVNTSDSKQSGKILLKALSGEEEHLILSNPDRGLFAQSNVNLAAMEWYNSQGEKITEAFANTDGHNMQSCLDNHLSDYITLQKLYVYPGYWSTSEIAKEGLERLQRCFDFARKNKIKLIFRLIYRNDYENAEGNGSIAQGVHLRHLEQIKPILEKNKDVLFVTEAGVLGTAGEWWDANRNNDWMEDYDLGRVMKAMLDITPEGIFMNVRQPYFRNDVIEDASLYSRMGHFNDSIFGNYDVNKGEDSVRPGQEGWQIVCDESPYVPCGGELYWGEWLYTEGSDGQWRRDGKPGVEYVEGFTFIEQAVQHHFTYLSATNNNRGNLAKGQPFSMDYWRATEITPEWCKQNKVLYDTNFWLDKDGKKIERNVYEFVRSFLGYRMQATEYKYNGTVKRGGDIDVQLNLVNYGFSRPYNLTCGYAILDENDKVVAEVKAGNPGDWQPWDPEKNTRGTLMNHSVSANLKLPTVSGTYKIAFFIRSTNGQYARMANDITTVNGYHILQEIVI